MPDLNEVLGRRGGSIAGFHPHGRGGKPHDGGGEHGPLHGVERHELEHEEGRRNDRGREGQQTKGFGECSHGMGQAVADFGPKALEKTM